MTAYALDYRADRVMIAADTVAYDDEARTPGGEVSKVLQLPHLKAAILSRGKFSIAVHALGRLLLMPNVQTIEDAAAALPVLLRGLTAGWAYKTATMGDYTKIVLMETALVGWSGAERRMRLWRWNSTDNYETHLEFDLAYGGPIWWPVVPRDYVPLDRSTDTVEMKLIGALHSMDRWCADHPDEANGYRLGGAIEMTTITERGIDQQVVGYFPGYEPAAEAVTAPTAPAQQPDNRQARRAAERQRRKAGR